MSPSPLGETLRRARTARGLKLEEAERVTRIPRKYLEALELENFGILPAPVYARGFLRSYAGYLGLEPNDLLPFFPVGHVDEPTLAPLPEMHDPRTWNLNGIMAMAVVGALILLVVALYQLGSGDGSSAFPQQDTAGNGGAGAGAGAQQEEQAPIDNGGVEATLPDLIGQTQQEAVAIIQATGAEPIIIGVSATNTPPGTVLDQDPDTGTNVGAGDIVRLTVSQ